MCTQGKSPITLSGFGTEIDTNVELAKEVGKKLETSKSYKVFELRNFCRRIRRRHWLFENPGRIRYQKTITGLVMKDASAAGDPEPRGFGHVTE